MAKAGAGRRQRELPAGTTPRPPASLSEARALAHPLRLRILRLCLDQALTNAQLADALGERPGTVLHHVRTLAAAGFLAEQGWRRGPRGSTEKPYRATGKSWYLDGAMTNDHSAMLRSGFAAVAAEIDEAGPDAVIEGARMAMRLGPEQLADLVAQLQGLMAQYLQAQEYLAAGPPDADPYAMLVVLHRRRLPANTNDTAKRQAPPAVTVTRSSGRTPARSCTPSTSSENYPASPVPPKTTTPGAKGPGC